jgi:branched-chain amino acid aminotransferase
MQVWLDGAMLPVEDVRLGLLTHALHYGTAIFDGCRFYLQRDGRTALFRLRDHLARLLRGAHALGIALGYGLDALEAASKEVVRAFGAPEGYLRQIAFFGEGRMGLGADNPLRVAMAAWTPLPGPAAPLSLRVASFGHGSTWAPGIKLAGHYARAVFARREARASGCDDALFLAADGTVTEATGANLFALLGGRLTTPPAWAPILPGITRETVIALATEAAIPVDERPLRRDDLLSAEEIFLCSSSAEIQPVARFEARTLPAPGPVTAALAARYGQVVRGEDEAHAPWLEVVP